MATLHGHPSRNGQKFWHLQDDNGEIICEGESHPTPDGVQRAVNNVADEFAKLPRDEDGNVIIEWVDD